MADQNSASNVPRKSFFRSYRAVLFAGIILLAGYFLGKGGYFSEEALKQKDHIARIEIKGIIAEDKALVSILKDVEKNSFVKGVIISLDSPGGSASASEELYDLVRAIAVKKPIATVVGNLAASGGYIVALATDQVFVRKNSIVGSIGVLFQYTDFSKIMSTLGFKIEEIKSSPLKASPNGFDPPSDQAKAVLNAVVQDTFSWFKNLVKERRLLTDEELQKVSDGRIFTGKQGLDSKLVDRLGGEDDAVNWLVSEKNLNKEYQLVDWKKPKKMSSWLSYVWGDVSEETSMHTMLQKIVSLVLGENPEKMKDVSFGLLTLFKI